MTKLIKKVQLNTEQNETLQSADSTKGTVTNPFTEEEFFHRYWYAEGNKELSSSEFYDIKSAVENLIPKSTKTITINNKTYVIKQYSLASHAIYGRALGTFSIYYEDSNAGGFKDIYDFNALPWGERELEAELLTRAISVLGSLYEAADYSITFGIHN